MIEFIKLTLKSGLIQQLFFDRHFKKPLAGFFKKSIRKISKMKNPVFWLTNHQISIR